MDETKQIKVNGVDIYLDPEKLRFNEASLSRFFEEEGLNYDFYGHQLAEAELVMQMYELNYDVKFSEKFKRAKEDGASDKLAEHSARIDPEVVELQKAVLAAKRNVRLLQQHLRAWDKTHENAQSRGHTLRREMDKLMPVIYGKQRELESEAERIVGGN